MNSTAVAVQDPDSFAAMFEESLTRKEMRAGELITAQVVRGRSQYGGGECRDSSPKV